jgi:hypothetical protein
VHSILKMSPSTKYHYRKTHLLSCTLFFVECCFLGTRQRRSSLGAKNQYTKKNNLPSVNTRQRIRTRHNRENTLGKEKHTAKRTAMWRVTLTADRSITAPFFAGYLQLDTRQRASLPGVFLRYTAKKKIQEGTSFLAQLCFSSPCVFWTVHSKEPLCHALN